MKKSILISIVALVSLLFVGCNDKLNIQQMYEFSLSTLPVQKTIISGKTVEIRCQLNRSGKYKDARYTISYFQPEGKGILKNENGIVFVPNDFYDLDNETFRLFYTSSCIVQQVIDISIRDNFNQEFKLSFSFTNDSGTVTRTGTGRRTPNSTN
ncbi:MAG: DUF3872 domain-containing protein [Bacteroidales bacterium]